jgi:uncharacterized protein (DUF1499 family)
MRINERETSSKARWSLRLALFSAQLLLVTVLLHRFTAFPTAPTINLMVIGLVLAAIAILFAVLAFQRIWNTGIAGTGVALTGLLIALTIYIVPLYYLPNLLRLPPINDITTDLRSPPQFEAIAQLREPDANPITYPGELFMTQQARTYPDITPLTLERPGQDAYELVRDVISDLGWEVVNDSPPQGASGVGEIEAVDHSLLLGFKDDVVVRVAGERDVARIDMRSASRYGRHDLGANANRIRELFGLVKNRIARAEARKLDAIERERIAEQLKEERRQRDLKRQEKSEQVVSGPAILPPAQFGQGMAGALPIDDPELATVDTAAPDTRPTKPSGFDMIDTLRKPQAAPSPRPSDATQKIQASKRSRREWDPFNLRP